MLQALDGPHHYQIADQGGLLVAISATDAKADIIKFSTDEGRCWHQYKFTDDPVVVTGLLTEPGNKAMSVAIWGYGPEDHHWKVHVLDFTKVIKGQCECKEFTT